jgi:hypothetical protein
MADGIKSYPCCVDGEVQLLVLKQAAGIAGGLSLFKSAKARIIS